MAIKTRAEITLVGVSDGAKGDKGDTGETGAAGADGKMLYGTCSTAAATAAKVATVTGFKLVSGTSASIRFTYTNTAASPTLNINSLGAKAVYANGTRYAYWAAGSTVTFVYDGTSFQVCSVPVYASTATVGNPGGGNVYVDGSSVNIRKGTDSLANFTSVNGTTFVKGYQNLMLCAGTADAPQSVYFTIPPAADGTESDFGMGFVVNGSSKHAYIASSDGVGNVIDWVVAKGTSGGWTYRKWASGIAELWRRETFSAGSFEWWNSTSYITYGANMYPCRNYPFTLKSYVSVTALAEDYQGCFLVPGNQDGEATLSRSPSFWVANVSSPSIDNTATPTISIKVVGRWK